MRWIYPKTMTQIFEKIFPLVLYILLMKDTHQNTLYAYVVRDIMPKNQVQLESEIFFHLYSVGFLHKSSSTGCSCMHSFMLDFNG